MSLLVSAIELAHLVSHGVLPLRPPLFPGRSSVLVHVAKVYSHLAAAGFDLPAVGPVFERYVRDHGLSERVKFHPGDFLKRALPGAEMRGSWARAPQLGPRDMLLGKAFAALPSGEALIVYELLLDDERRTSSSGLLNTLNLLVMTDGGFDFTASDCIG